MLTLLGYRCVEKVRDTVICISRKAEPKERSRERIAVDALLRIFLRVRYAFQNTT